MFRAVWFMLLLGVLAITAMWFADDPGQVSVTWHGYVIETSAAVLAGVIATITVLSSLIYRLWIFICGVPAGISCFRGEGRRRRGYLALSRGMVAVAAGDPGEALRQAEWANNLLEEPSLTMLLTAQSAQLGGDEVSAHKCFIKMLEDPNTEFLGLRGLLNQAIKNDDNYQALKWVRRAYQLKPENDWTARTMFDLSARAGLWTEAYSALSTAVRKKQMDSVEAKHSRAVLYHQMSVEAEASGDNDKALKLSKKAVKEELEFVPAQVYLAHLLMSSGKRHKAVIILEAAWAIIPHPEIAHAYLSFAEADDVMARMKAAHKLAVLNPKHPATKLMLVDCALNAGLWGDARKNLEEVGALDKSTTSNYCQLMAKLEEAEHSDMISAREWLVRATNADADPSWVCQDCGNAADTWSCLCGACSGFDKLQWRRPSRVPGLGTPINDDLKAPRLVSSSTRLAQDIDANGAED
jgi:HemY protein